MTCRYCRGVSGSAAATRRYQRGIVTLAARCGQWMSSLLAASLIVISATSLARADCSADDVHPAPGGAFIDFPAGMTVTVTLEKVTHDYGLYLLGTLPADTAIATLNNRGVRRLTDVNTFEFWVDNGMNAACQTQTCSLPATFETASERRLGLGQWRKAVAETEGAAHGDLTVGAPEGAHRIKLDGIPSSEGNIRISWDCTPNSSLPVKPAK